MKAIYIKTWRRTFYIFTLIPGVFIVSLMSFYVHTAIILNYIPSYDKPDPHELGIDNSYSSVITPAFFVWIYSLPLWTIALVSYLVIHKKKIEWAPVIISSTGHFLAVLLLFSGIFEWYID